MLGTKGTRLTDVGAEVEEELAKEGLDCRYKVLKSSLVGTCPEVLADAIVPLGFEEPLDSSPPIPAAVPGSVRPLDPTAPEEDTTLDLAAADEEGAVSASRIALMRSASSATSNSGT